MRFLGIIIVIIVMGFLFLKLFNSDGLTIDKKTIEQNVKEIDSITLNVNSGDISDKNKDQMDETEKEVFDETGYRRMSKDEVDKQQELLKGLMNK